MGARPVVSGPAVVVDVDGVLWATQLRSANAAPVSAPGAGLAFSEGMPHDGRWKGDQLLFTTTNGHLVLADPRRGAVARHVALAEITPGLEQLGWCRGVCEDPRDPARVFVAFSSVRRSRWQEFGYWIRWRQPPVHGRVVLYDIEAGRLCESWDVGDGAGDVLFQLPVSFPNFAASGMAGFPSTGSLGLGSYF